MTQRILLSALLSFCCLSGLTALDAGVSIAIFSTGEKPYVEVNFEIAGASVAWRAADSVHMSSSIEVLMLVQQNDNVINFEKYVLNSPPVRRPISLLDGKRLAVMPGACTLDVTFRDLFDTSNTKRFQFPLEIDVTKTPYLSELQLLRSFRADESDHAFTKNGFFMEPLPFLFYDKSASELSFYCEVYNTKNVVKDPKYLIRYFIEHEMGNGRTNLEAIGSQRRVPSDMDGILMQMDISKLPSGNYTLTVEVRNLASEKLAERKVAFQRSNPYLNVKPGDITEEAITQQFVQQLSKDELVFMMRALVPIVPYADAETVNNILQAGDEKGMRFFVFNHFVMQHPTDPKAAYDRYLAVAKAVDATYRSGFGYGFETDRGTTFLRYGKPDDVIRVEDEPSAPPYEIWVYYKLARSSQTNVKFLFYNPSLADEDFTLLHSTARGERSNPRWEVDLYRRNAPNEFQGDNFQDATSMQQNNFRVARRYFESF